MSRSLAPLSYQTPRKWALIALQDPLALLSDHAYLERKAASNALELLNRWPDPLRPPTWERTLAGVARDEASHLAMVLRHLEKRGGRLARLHKSDYATALRALVRMGRGPQETLDRLLVTALIEARSCERFQLLSRACRDKELAQFYKNLWVSEAGHYRVYVALAKEILPQEVDARWDELKSRESAIIQAQPAGCRIHSGLPREVVSSR